MAKLRPKGFTSVILNFFGTAARSAIVFGFLVSRLGTVFIFPISGNARGMGETMLLASLSGLKYEKF